MMNIKDFKGSVANMNSTNPDMAFTMKLNAYSELLQGCLSFFAESGERVWALDY